MKDRERITVDLHILGLGPPEPRELAVRFEERYGIGLYLADLSYAEVFVVLANSDTMPFRAECHLAFYVCQSFHLINYLVGKLFRYASARGFPGRRLRHGNDPASRDTVVRRS